jgi:hypothetical protein
VPTEYKERNRSRGAKNERNKQKKRHVTNKSMNTKELNNSDATIKSEAKK